MQVLAHNLAAQFTNRQLNITTNQNSKSSEKLSSGYRINRSADDAAGLSISEEMRRQIRGLNKGGTNIQEGISLCQIADGALGEVTSILQRMRQLTIQAYNGTNSKSDRACIQDEIDNCLEGINEIQERTKYNELYVLKNNGRSDLDKVQRVWVDQSYTVTRVATQYEAREMPSWLKINGGNDSKIDYRQDNAFTQDPSISGIMLQDYDYHDANGKDQRLHVYFGAENAPHPDGYIWIGNVPDMANTDPASYDLLMKEAPKLKDFIDTYITPGSYTGWTTNSNDNVSCKIDFSGLEDSSNNVDELMTNMFELLGNELGFPCGSCDNFNAVQFTGEIGGYTVTHKGSGHYYYSADAISLTENTFSYKAFFKDENGKLQSEPHTYTKDDQGYIGAIASLQNIDDPAEQAKEVKALARAIAKDLTNRIKDALSISMQGHFDRVTSDPSSSTSLYVFDYRDQSTLTSPNKTNTHMINSTGWVESSYTYEETIPDGFYANIKKGNPSIQIQGSATVGDSIPLELRSMSTTALGLDGYNINKYKREKVYDSAYDAKMKAYQKALANMEYVEVTSEETYTVTKKPAVYKSDGKYVDGEFQHIVTLVSPAEYETKTRTVTSYRPKYQLTEPQPSTVEVYAPSDLDILDKAMDQVSKMRSYFGASQNRLEHAYAANKNTEENTTAAESRIRDTDMTEEMVNFSKNNILAQVGQSMLTQANQSTQGILSLLQ